MLIAWLLFPLVLAALALGCGLLVQRAAGETALPNVLPPPAVISFLLGCSCCRRAWR